MLSTRVGKMMEELHLPNGSPGDGRRGGGPDGGPDGGEVEVLMEESHTHCSSLEGRVPQSDLTSCLSDACELSLDPTPSQQTAVSEDGRQRQPSSPLPERSEGFLILQRGLTTGTRCREALTGHCYWEEEWEGDVDIGMAYRGI
ncbi:unnamed protein product [Arctogadus glacialis]